MIPFNRVIQGDVHQTLLSLPSDTFACGIADVPYGTKLKTVTWDARPDYGPWIELAYRVLAPGGTFYVFGKPEIIIEHWFRFPGPKNFMIWFITNRTQPKLKWWQPSFDGIVAFSKGQPRFLRDQVRQDYSEVYRKLLGTPRPASRGRYGIDATTYTDNGGTLAKNVLVGPGLFGSYGQAERVGHPTQKPLWLMERLILGSTLPGESVLDLFAGAGTTSVAAARLGRKWLAVEREPQYVDMITARIAALPGGLADPKLRVDFEMDSKRSFEAPVEGE